MIDFRQCPCAGNTLDKLVQPAILSILANRRLHGYALAERIAGMPMFAGQKPDVSGVYRILKTMEGRGFVVCSWDISGSGPAKKSYRLTKAGQQCLSHWIETLQEYRQGITALLKTARKAVAERSRVRGVAPRRRTGANNTTG